ncbi:MAG: hypothetical protein HQL52_04625 [Magnetococcales bacterium]|nr:hypothetical protein [Magnetococcales bacterium]
MSQKKSEIHCAIHLFDPPSDYDERIIQARKQHRCVECPDPIKPGEWYVLYRRIRKSRKVGSFKRCGFCASAAKKAGFPTHFGQLAKMVRESLGANREGALQIFGEQGWQVVQKKYFQVFPD